MAIDSWERFCEIEALMQPGGPHLDPLEQTERTGPVALVVGDDERVGCLWCGEPTSHADAKLCQLADCRVKYAAFRKRNPNAEPASG